RQYRPNQGPAKETTLLVNFGKEQLSNSAWRPIVHDRMSSPEGSSVLDLKAENFFSCAFSRKQSDARYPLHSSDDVVALLKDLEESQSSN
ncbi:hypothetical protein NC651_026751, partial [Populus alba x Populus x berolinensis]